MLYSLYLRQGVVFVPTTGLRGSVYTDIEPVVTTPLSDVESLRQALKESISRGNPPVPAVTGKWPKPVVLKHAGVKSWSAFARSASTWGIKKNDNGSFKIVGYKVHPKGYWAEDRDQDIEFPTGSTADDVVDRLIAILQNAAQK